MSRRGTSDEKRDVFIALQKPLKDYVYSLLVTLILVDRLLQDGILAIKLKMG